MAQIVENPLLYWPASLVPPVLPMRDVSAVPACVIPLPDEAGPAGPGRNSKQQTPGQSNAAATQAASPR